MYVVGIAELSGTIQDEAPALAGNLGVTAYDARMLLAPGIPALLQLTQDRSRALQLLADLRARGHQALAFDASAVTSNRDMVWPRSFALAEDGLTTGSGPEHLAFSDITVMLRATHESHVESTVETKERKFSAGRAMLTGGVVMTKTNKKTASSHAWDKHEVLYIYLRGKRPWILREIGTRYEGLGAEMASTERANFLKMIELVRLRAPLAVYDQRLVGRKIPERLAQVAVQGLGTSASRVETSNDTAMDLLCHLTAMWHSKQQPT